MAKFKLPYLDEEMLEDLLEEIKMLYEDSERILIELEQKPKDIELQRSLFRAIHTIKGNLGLVSITPIVPLTSSVEDLLDLLRNGKINYNSIMSDLVLLTMDIVETFVEKVIKNGEIEYDDVMYDDVVKTVKRITPNNKNEHDKILTDAVIILDPSLKVEPPETNTLPKSDIVKELSEDLLFFREMMFPVEKRSKYWQNRGDRIAKLCLLVNKLAGNIIDSEQLLAACYLHDFGMAFISLKILHKNAPLDEKEKQVVKEHVLRSAHLLQDMQRWQGALNIIMQHHERCNGSGYPLGLQKNEICDGAKLLAIADSFDALTHERAFSSHSKRPIKRAAIELNSERGRLFDEFWLDHFNQAMAKIIQRNKTI